MSKSAPHDGLNSCRAIVLQENTIQKPLHAVGLKTEAAVDGALSALPHAARGPHFRPLMCAGSSPDPTIEISASSVLAE